MLSDDGTDRRTVLKALGGTATLVAGGTALIASTGGAAATASQSLNNVTVSSDDGSVDYVAIYGDTTVEWDGFENPAKSFGIVSEVKVVDSNGNAVVPRTSINTSGPHDLTAESWGGTSETHTGTGTSGTLNSDVGLDSNGDHDPSTDWAILQSADHSDPYGLPTNPADAAKLNVDGDGSSATYTVTLYSTYTWYRSTDGTGEEYSEEFATTFDVVVNNEPRSTTASSGSGEDGAVGG